MTLTEAAEKLQETLTVFAGPHGWGPLGIVENPPKPHLIVYTETRRTRDRILSFLGPTFEGYPVRGVVLGKVQLLMNRR